jgi:hypothetical protein
MELQSFRSSNTLDDRLLPGRLQRVRSEPPCWALYAQTPQCLLHRLLQHGRRSSVSVDLLCTGRGKHCFVVLYQVEELQCRFAVPLVGDEVLGFVRSLTSQPLHLFFSTSEHEEGIGISSRAAAVFPESLESLWTRGGTPEDSLEHLLSASLSCMEPAAFGPATFMSQPSEFLVVAVPAPESRREKGGPLGRPRIRA